MYKYLVKASMGLNRLLRGERGQTFSARNWQLKKDQKPNVVFAIDWMLGKDHCVHCWINWKLKK